MWDSDVQIMKKTSKQTMKVLQRRQRRKKRNLHLPPVKLKDRFQREMPLRLKMR